MTSKSTRTIDDRSYPTSYYAATLNDDLRYAALSDNQQTEVCVIGAGYAGLMTALGLLERGVKDVALVESHRVGWGASGRNGGFVFGGFSLGPSALVKQVGVVKARELYGHTVHAVDLIRQRIHDYKIDCDAEDSGVLWANWFRSQKRLLDEQRFMREVMHVDWDYISPQALSTQLCTQRYCGALKENNALHIHPLNFARGIAAVIAQKGGTIYEQTAVSDIHKKGVDYRVVCGQHSIQAKKVVLCGGGYVGSLCPPIARSILPIATYVMATEPLGERLSQYVNTQSAVYDTRFAFDYYRPLNDTRLLWGGRISARMSQPPNLEQLLRRDLHRVFPELEGVGIDYLWDGWMGYPRHKMPEIGQLQENLWYVIGFGGHGVAPTTMGGELAASAIAADDTRYQAFAPWPPRWAGGPFGPFAAQGAYWWYALKDWARERVGG